MAFKRGKDPEQVLLLGNHRPYNIGDKLICTINIYRNNQGVLAEHCSEWTTDIEDRITPPPTFQKSQECTIRSRTNPRDERIEFSVKQLPFMSEPFIRSWFYKEELDKWFKRA